MRSFIAFLKKEMIEIYRTGKLIILGAVFLLFGIMNPAIAKLTPFLMEMMSEELAGNGIVITEVTVDAITSWTQFFKNIPMALIAFVLLCGNIFTKEYASGTLLLILTKGISRQKILLAKIASLLCVWTLGYWLCFGITYAYNEYFWDNSIVNDLFTAVFDQWLFGIFVIALTVFFSVISESFGSVLTATAVIVFASYIVSLFPKLTCFMPTALMNSSVVLTGSDFSEDHITTVITASVLSILLTASSIPIMNKKQL